MADEIFMFATTAGTMAALTALLFAARGRRTSKSNTEIINDER
jgi:hypothetical protein